MTQPAQYLLSKLPCTDKHNSRLFYLPQGFIEFSKIKVQPIKHLDVPEDSVN